MKKILMNFVESVESSTNKEKNASESVAELFKNVFPNVWVMLATTLALILMIIFLTIFVYKPLKKVIQERRDFIQENIDNSIKSKEKALELENQRNQELWEARIAASQIISQAKIESEKIVFEYTSNAKKEAKRILEDAHITISQLQKKFESESKEEIISVATKLASKILEKHVSSYENHDLIEKLLNEMEN